MSEVEDKLESIMQSVDTIAYAFRQAGKAIEESIADLTLSAFKVGLICEQLDELRELEGIDDD